MFKTLFGLGGPKVDLGQKINEGAQIIDVRTPDEFRSGHVKGAVNIPLDRLQGQLAKIDKNKAVITCCRSGARSGMAADMLKNAGFDAYNGGPWQNVQALK
ncbi:MAG: rhodanese-like domain-containing protein [Flavobacteriales bacterium]|nr:rhodanese-like domain-containing protein [Flavobacteriales bacterium]HPF91543.1 rhodanese-like domain-containing protein [Flavobacteriales bacterium]